MKNFLKKALPIIIITFILTVLFRSILFREGMIISADSIFPFEMKNFIKFFYPLWNELFGIGSIENTGRLLFIVPLYGILSFITTNAEIFIRIIYFSIYLTAALGMYFLAKYIFSLNSDNKRIVLIASIVASIFYAYNPWSIQRLSHYFLLVGYALTPLVLLLFIKTLRRDKWIVLAILTAFLWSLGSTTPHYSLFLGLILAIFLSIKIVVFVKKNDFKKIASHLKKFATIVWFYLIISLYWIVPTIYSLIASKNLRPSLILTTESIDMLSRNSSLFNSIRLLGYWWIRINLPSPNTVFGKIWLILSFILIIIIFYSFLYAKRNKYILYFSIMLFLFVFLSSGTKSLFPSFYYFLNFKIPFFSSFFGGLLREPFKFGGFTALCLAILFGFALIMLAEKLNRSSLTKNLLIASFIFVLLGFSLPIGENYLNSEYNPTKIPQEFYRLNEKLSKDYENFKTLWLPYYGQKTTPGKDGTLVKWNGNHLTGPFNVYSSVKNVLNPADSRMGFYLNFLYEEMKDNKFFNNLTSFVEFLNTRYIIFHDDIVGLENENQTVKDNLEDQRGLNKIETDGYLTTFESESYFPKIFNYVGPKLFISGGLRQLNALSEIPGYRISDYPTIFLDQNTNNDLYYNLKDNDILVTNGGLEDILFSNVPEDVFIFPSQYSRHAAPWDNWAVTSSYQQGWNNYLALKGIKDWGLDYEKGLIFSDNVKKKDIKIDIPLKVKENNDYYLNFRVLNNEKGGSIEILLDNNSILNIDTKNFQNCFGWYSTRLSLQKGDYKLILKNVSGFNAVSTITVVNTDDYNMLLNNTKELIERSNSIIALPANKYLSSENNPILQNNLVLSDRTDQTSFYIPKSGFYNILLKGQRGIGNTLNLVVNGTIKDIQIEDQKEFLVQKKIFLNKGVNTITLSDNNTYSSLSATEELKSSLSWKNNSPESQIIDIDEEDYILKSELEKGNSPNWRTLTLKDIYLNKELKNLLLKFNLTTSNVNQLHLKAYFYNNSELVKTTFVDAALDGNVEDRQTTKIVEIPQDADKVIFSFWVRQNKDTESSWKLNSFLINNPNDFHKISSVIMSDLDLDNLPKSQISFPEFKKIDATRYKVNFNSDSDQNVLVFSETFSPMWTAIINGSEVKPQVLWATINGFFINKAGGVEITIEFTPQKYLFRGIYFSLISFGLSLFIIVGSQLLYKVRRKKHENK